MCINLLMSTRIFIRILMVSFIYQHMELLSIIKIPVLITVFLITVYEWDISAPEWIAATNYHDAIPRKQQPAENFWFVSSDIITYGTVYGYMVYSRNGRLPINYIKELRSEEREWYTRSYIVNIIKHLDGWYELRRK